MATLIVGGSSGGGTAFPETAERLRKDKEIRPIWSHNSRIRSLASGLRSARSHAERGNEERAPPRFGSVSLSFRGLGSKLGQGLAGRLGVAQREVGVGLQGPGERGAGLLLVTQPGIDHAGVVEESGVLGPQLHRLGDGL